MSMILLHTLKRMRGSLLGWGLSLAGLSILYMTFYGDVAAQGETINRLLQSYPPELMAFFGTVEDLTSPQGFLGMYFFSYMPLILGIFAVLAGAGLLLQDEEEGVLDLLLAHPISRTEMFLGRLLGLWITTAGILALALAGMAFSSQWSELDLAIPELVKPFFTLYVQLLFLSALALKLSMLLPSRSAAGLVSGLLLLVAYFINSLSFEVESLRPAARLTPMHYYQGARALAEPLDWGPIAALLALSALFIALAWWRWQRRDIRVAGEGLWSWKSLLTRVRGGAR